MFRLGSESICHPFSARFFYSRPLSWARKFNPKQRASRQLKPAHRQQVPQALRRQVSRKICRSP